MKRKTKAITAASLVVFILAGIAAVSLTSDTEKITETLNSGNVLNSGSTANNINGNEYTAALENEYLRFYINNDTTEFKVVNKQNGSEWYSSAAGREDGSAEAAPLRLSYLNSQGSLADMNVMTDSVEDGKYTVENDGSRVTVRYSVGDFSELSLVPYALTEERFNEIIGRLDDEFEQMKLTDLYYLTDINIIEDADQKKERLAEYPLLAKQKLYIIRDSTKEDALAKKDIAKIFASAGYTEDDYKADSKYFSADSTAKTAPGFNVRVEYTLEGNKLKVLIPHDGIEMYKDFPMTSLTFAPYFGSPAEGTKGWYLLPDGSGSVMNFYNGSGSGKIYRTSLYGEEPTVAGRENISSDVGASLPVFGICSGGSGVLCEITQGDAISEIEAYPGSGADKPYAHAVFNVRSTYKTTATTGKKESYIIVQKSRYSGDIALEYSFIGSQNAGLSDMAEVVRKSIFANTEEKASDLLPVRLTLAGLITRRNQFLGVAYNQKIVLTDFKQSLAAAEAFTDSGTENLSVVLTGWFGDGIDHKFLSGKVSPSSLLGGKKDFTELINKLGGKNIPLYLDADIQYTAKTSFFDGFKTKSDTVTMLDQSVGKLIEYDPASFIKKTGGTTYINNAAAEARALAALKSTADEYGVKGLSLRSVGAALSADYGSPAVDRQAMANSIASELKKLSDAGYLISSGGAGAYILPYISNSSAVPVTSGGFDTTDMSVPFLQMVLGGYVDYYAPDINLSGDTQTALLRAVSAGAGISCILTAQNADRLGGSDQSSLYSTDFEYWKEKLPVKIADIQNRLKPVAGKRIVGYEKLAQGVYKTVYNGGAEVIVNYNSEPFKYGDITVNSEDFALKGVLS